MYPEDQLLPLSALQHYLFCPRQTALIHLEQVWADNRYTAEGNLLHKKAHSDHDEIRAGVKITRSLPVRSLTLGISGQCDIVEFHKNGTIIPVEYKRGKPKTHSADEIQVCAQAMCLEEMLSTPIHTAYLFYGKQKRRTPVNLDKELRNLTTHTAQKLHNLISKRKTPHATYDPKRCDTCSLINLCQPKGLRLKRGVSSWFRHQVAMNSEQ